MSDFREPYLLPGFFILLGGLGAILAIGAFCYVVLAAMAIERGLIDTPLELLTGPLPPGQYECVIVDERPRKGQLSWLTPLPRHSEIVHHIGDCGYLAEQIADGDPKAAVARRGRGRKIEATIFHLREKR